MEQDNIYRKLADQVQEALNNSGLKPADLARELGVSSAYITQFLKHAQKTPAERIQQMLDPLGYELRVVEKKTLSISER